MALALSLRILAQYVKATSCPARSANNFEGVILAQAFDGRIEFGDSCDNRV